MCWKKKKDTSEKEEIPPPPPPPPISDQPKKTDNEGSRKGDDAGSKKKTKSIQGPSMKEENTQASEPIEGGDGTPKESAEPPKRMPQPKSGRPKPKTEYWKEADPLKAVDQFRSGTEAVDDAEFGWTDGKTGGLTMFPCDKAEKEIPFAETKEMKAQDVEYKAGLKRRKMQVEMTQSSRMGKIAAELRTKTQEAC